MAEHTFADDSWADFVMHVRTETPLAQVEAYAKARRHIDSAVRVAVVDARHQGATWEQLGDALGVSASAAHQRFATEVARVAE